MTKILKTVQLTDQEWKALDAFLDELKDHQSNAGCNDLQKNIRNLWTEEEGIRMSDEFAKVNNPSMPNGPDWPLPDFCLLELLRHKIKQQVSENYYNVLPAQSNMKYRVMESRDGDPPTHYETFLSIFDSHALKKLEEIRKDPANAGVTFTMDRIDVEEKTTPIYP